MAAGLSDGDYVPPGAPQSWAQPAGHGRDIGCDASDVTRLEAGAGAAVALVERALAAGGLTLVVVESSPADGDAAGLRFVPPLLEFGDCRDGAGRRYPAHLPLVVDPVRGEWWGDAYGLVRPPETYYRSKVLREVRRRESRWQLRHDVRPPDVPLALMRAAVPERVFQAARAAHRRACHTGGVSSTPAATATPTERAVTPYPDDAPASAALFERARVVTPGGVNSPVRAFRAVGGTPRFMVRGEGPYLYDADGREYVDLVCSWGPMILGHGHPRVVEAVRAATDLGFSFGTPTENEVLLAEEIVRRVAPVERVRLVSSAPRRR